MNDDHRPDEIASALGELAETLRDYLADRPQLRRTVHGLARLMLAVSQNDPSLSEAQNAAELAVMRDVDEQEVRAAPGAIDEMASEGVGMRVAAAPAGVGSEPSRPATTEVQEPTAGTPASHEPIQTEKLPLRIGDAQAEVEVDGTAQEIEAARVAEPAASGVRPELVAEAVVDLSLIERRCRLKAEACRWAVYKRGRLQEGADFFVELRAQEDDLRARLAAAPDCFIPVLARDAWLPPDAELDHLALWFDTLAAAAGAVVLADGSGEREIISEAFQHMATAQAGLREAVRAARLMYYERDQEEAFRWLDLETKRRMIFIPRHMRLSDRPGPDDSHEALGAIGKLATNLRRRADDERRRRELFNALRYHARRLLDGDSDHDWERLRRCIEDLLDLGVPATAREWGTPLLNLVERMRERSLGLAAERILRGLGLEEPAPVVEVTVPDHMEEVQEPENNEELARAASLLRGKRALLFGGEEREHARQKLQSALELKELRWMTKREHGSTAPFEHAIKRPDVDVVFFLSKLSNTHDGPEIRQMCRKYGKPCVMIPAGYNAAQVAHQFLEQASAPLLATMCGGMGT